MPLPTPRNLQTMDYAYQGQPFVYVPAKSDINTRTMDYAYQAQPFVVNNLYIKKIASVLLSSIKKIAGISYTAIKNAVEIPY